MVANWDELARRLPAGLSMLGSMVTICTSSFTRPEQKKSVQDFFEKRDTRGFAMALAQSGDSIQAKCNWLARDREDVAAWVARNGL